MNLENILGQLFEKTNNVKNKGKLASYIPELTKVNPKKFGVSITTIDNKNYKIGDFDEKFSIQSISKVLSLSLAFKIVGNDIWNRIGVEPSGTSFNSLVQIELEKGIPRNPFINAGAIVVADILINKLENPKEDFLNFVRSLSDNPNINYSEKIFLSEKNVAFRNIALCNLMKSFGNIDNNAEEVLDFYINICSLEMNCLEISNTFIFLANQGISLTNKTILTKSKVKRINAIMQTCGMYDESGEFSFKVGLPGKSGVGGGIIAIHPNRYSIATWSPLLNKKGNSYKGMKFLEEFTTKSELSIF